jgi:alpha-ketoglutarate-dependent taurine dioxygenase
MKGGSTMAETMALDAELGAELVDYGDGENLLDDAVIAQCREALKWRGVLLIRGAHLDDDTQVAFSRKFGGEGGVPGGRELSTITMDKKVNKLAEYLKGAFNWHLDDTTSDVPSRATMLTGRRLSSEGGGTEFANTYAAYENLPAHERKRYDGLRVVHSFEAAQRKVNPDPTDEELAGWRSAPTHESSLVWKRRDGRRSLVIGATADHIVGIPAEESRELLDELLAWATQSRFCYTHDWAVGDAVLWDNTAVLHRALPYDPSSDRMLRRTHVKGQEAWT